MDSVCPSYRVYLIKNRFLFVILEQSSGGYGNETIPGSSRVDASSGSDPVDATSGNSSMEAGYGSSLVDVSLKPIQWMRPLDTTRPTVWLLDTNSLRIGGLSRALDQGQPVVTRCPRRLVEPTRGLRDVPDFNLPLKYFASCFPDAVSAPDVPGRRFRL